MTVTEQVLITRPLAQGRALMSALAQAGISARHVPLIEIRASEPALARLPQQVAQLPAGSLVIAVSRPAVELANRCLPTWPPELQYWAVGSSTARQWRVANPHAIRVPEQATSEGLLEQLQLQQLAQRQVLLLRGCGGRELLVEGLRQRGARVDLAELYQRICPPLDGAVAAAQWHQAGISVLVATSGAILNNLQALVPPAYHGWLFRCHLIVVSERLAHLAHAMGFTQVTVAAGADDHSLLTCLKQVIQR